MNDDPRMPDKHAVVTNWVERLVRLEALHRDNRETITAMNEEVQKALIRNAEANERIAAHFEESRRVWNRLNELEETIHLLDKTLIELRENGRQLMEFSMGVKKTAWVAVTCGGIILWWIIQRWVESHGR